MSLLEPRRDPAVSAYRRRWGGIFVMVLGVIALVRWLMATGSLTAYRWGGLIGVMILLGLGGWLLWSSRRRA